MCKFWLLLVMVSLVGFAEKHNGHNGHSSPNRPVVDETQSGEAVAGKLSEEEVRVLLRKLEEVNLAVQAGREAREPGEKPSEGQHYPLR